MESERVVRRYVIAGALLVGGFVVGLWLVATFRWYPYYWQWLAYHTGVVVVVVIYLAVSAFGAEVPRDAPRASPRPYPRPGRPADPGPASWWTAGGPAYWSQRGGPRGRGSVREERYEGTQVRQPSRQPPSAASTRMRARRSPPMG